MWAVSGFERKKSTGSVTRQIAPFSSFRSRLPGAGSKPSRLEKVRRRLTLRGKDSGPEAGIKMASFRRNNETVCSLVGDSYVVWLTLDEVRIYMRNRLREKYRVPGL